MRSQVGLKKPGGGGPRRLYNTAQYRLSAIRQGFRRDRRVLWLTGGVIVSKQLYYRGANPSPVFGGKTTPLKLVVKKKNKKKNLPHIMVGYDQGNNQNGTINFHRQITPVIPAGDLLLGFPSLGDRRRGTWELWRVAKYAFGPNNSLVHSG